MFFFIFKAFCFFLLFLNQKTSKGRFFGFMVFWILIFFAQILRLNHTVIISLL